MSFFLGHNTRSRPVERAAFRCAVLVCLLGFGSGCVQRRMTIVSNPPGAQVFIDGYEIGTTPVATDYIYYGTRQIKLVKDRYETLTVMEPIRAPWYQIPPLDFVSENVVPTEIRDERVLRYDLVPQRIVPQEELVGRAEGLRQASAIGVAGPAGALPPGATYGQPGAMYGSPGPPVGLTPLPPGAPLGQPHAIPPQVEAVPPGGNWIAPPPRAGSNAP